ncbi:MAG TPA: TRAP transporter fused permease subunit [Pseudolabrys sp.]|nr:TRAP transporter fused permease subunit [Pseudolabrys sp.]
MSEIHPATGAAEPASAAPKAVAFCTDVLQALLLISVVAWALDLPRRLFGLSFYTEQLLAICLGLSLALSFVGAKFPQRWMGWAGAIASLVICAYIAARYEALTTEIALLPTEGIVGSAILVVLVLEATRRTAGGVLIAIILAISAYVFIGPHMPGDFATRPVSPERLLVYLGLDINGMIGAILSVAVLIVVPFTLMGQVLGRTGGAAYFADLAMSAMGNFRGGAAKIAVVGSALFGTISGAAVSNVVAVGIVTIPLMSRSGFSPTRAAAIESVGSTGGQLMPPVMGAAAFIMAEFLQVPYSAVVVAAVIPAVLYYAALFIHVDLEAAKHKIGAVKIDNIPSFIEVLRSGWHFPIPIAFLIATLIWPEVFQIPIERAAIYSTAMLVVLSLAFGYRGNRVTPRQMLRAILDTGRAALDIVLIGAAAGMVVGALNISGISFGLMLQLIAISGENLFVLLLLTAVISIILGMGMPTVSVYVLTASLLAPSIVKLGVSPMAAHMYVMYFGMLSMITPPVAIAAYAAANIARVSGWTTGWTAVVVGWSTFFIPFLFVTEPSMLMNDTASSIVWNFSRNIFGIFVGTAGIVGFAFGPLGVPMRIAFGVSAVAILIPPHVFAGADMLDWAGLGAATVVLAVNWMQSRAAKQAATPQAAGP